MPLFHFQINTRRAEHGPGNLLAPGPGKPLTRETFAGFECDFKLHRLSLPVTATILPGPTVTAPGTGGRAQVGRLPGGGAADADSDSGATASALPARPHWHRVTEPRLRTPSQTRARQWCGRRPGTLSWPAAARAFVAPGADRPDCCLPVLPGSGPVARR